MNPCPSVSEVNYICGYHFVQFRIQITNMLFYQSLQWSVMFNKWLNITIRLGYPHCVQKEVVRPIKTGKIDCSHGSSQVQVDTYERMTIASYY